MTTPVILQAPPHLTGHHRHTYEAIFHHPVAQILEWQDVRSFLDAIGDVTEGDNGILHLNCNGQTLLLHPTKNKTITDEVVQDIRRFLEASGIPGFTASAAKDLDLLVVIDHHEAKVYRLESHGSNSQKLVPYDPHGFRRHLHSQAEETDGKRKPERKSFYEAIASTLHAAGRVLIFGSGTGRSNAMEQLMADLTAHHPEVAAKVLAAVVVEDHHKTEPQLLAEARAAFAKFDSMSPGATERTS